MGRHEAAVKMWRLALVLDPAEQDTKGHLRKAGASEKIKVSFKEPLPSEELSRSRTTGIPRLPKQTAAAEFWLLVSKSGVDDAQFISGSDSLQSAGQAIQSSYKLAFPDEGPEKLIRRGIVSCSSYTAPSCQMTLMLPTTVHK